MDNDIDFQFYIRWTDNCGRSYARAFCWLDQQSATDFQLHYTSLGWSTGLVRTVSAGFIATAWKD